MRHPGPVLRDAMTRAWWRRVGRRVQQLTLPTRPLDVARGLDSRVRVISDASGGRHAAAWLRTLRATGEYLYSGWYSIRRRIRTGAPWRTSASSVTGP